MSHHIIHLLSPGLRVRMRLDQLHVTDKGKGAEKSIPLRDIALVVCAAPDASFTAGALRRAAELGVVVLVCDEKFSPACLTVPYFRATTADLPRRQAAWSVEWREACWRAVISAKVANQAACATPVSAKTAEALRHIATRCAREPVRAAALPRDPKRLARVTLSQRDEFRTWTPDACESRAARLYWRAVLPKLDPAARRREGGTRDGVNGMLDYGYAIVRTAVLRSLAGHGFIAALGIHHTTKPGAQPLADDLMEPLRPFIDRALLAFLQTPAALAPDHAERMRAWIPRAAAVLMEPLPLREGKVRLLNAIDLYIQSFATACGRGQPEEPVLRFPFLPPLESSPSPP